MTETDQSKAARAALAAANQRHTESKKAVADAVAAHQRAVEVHRQAAATLRGIVTHDNELNANAAARLAAIIRSGDAASIDDAQQDHSERLEAERRAAIAQGAVDALAADVQAAQVDQTAAQTAVDTAIKGVMLAHRDALAAELTAAAAQYLDLRHKLGGLMGGGMMGLQGIPGTAETAAALASVERDYPPILHPQNFAAKAWAEMQKGLREDSEAAYVPITPTFSEPVDPQHEHRLALRKAQDAEREANAAKNAEKMAGYAHVDVMSERMHQFVVKAAGG
ncbi:hypothetical protein [Caballeronia sordidicola]|uniref:Uncharacterized protein n=1 Tax=Caballeronia sordidicola TaxID=196367 RepID=A0A242MME2_CABSO|nr:hypothetical protein [Caballeronia sordidicola]OTP72371.1 hypothetical protein PAMC26510_21330 [Caballeronia sordidicola]